MAPEPWLDPSQRNGVLAAVIALTRVYVGLAGRGAGAGHRYRLGVLTARLGPAGAFAVSVAGWLGFVAVAFLGDTLTGGLAPTAPRSARSSCPGRTAELVRLRPSPAVAEPGLLLR